MRNWINLIEGSTSIENISEAFEAGLKYTRRGESKTVEIFRNPTPKEYNECLGDNGSVRAFLIGSKTIIIWDTFTLIHQEVREQLGVDKIAIPVIIFGHPGRECAIQVTDNSKNTIWWHNPEVIDFIQRHPFLNRAFSNIEEISFYDEDIYDKWDNLKDN